jgi:hypothetical protein
MIEAKGRGVLFFDMVDKTVMYLVSSRLEDFFFLGVLQLKSSVCKHTLAPFISVPCASSLRCLYYARLLQYNCDVILFRWLEDVC